MMEDLDFEDFPAVKNAYETIEMFNMMRSLKKENWKLKKEVEELRKALCPLS